MTKHESWCAVPGCPCGGRPETPTPAPRVVVECWTCERGAFTMYLQTPAAIERHKAAGHDVREVTR